MAIFRDGVKIGNHDIRISAEKKRVQGILRQAKILKDGAALERISQAQDDLKEISRLIKTKAGQQKKKTMVKKTIRK